MRWDWKMFWAGFNDGVSDPRTWITSTIVVVGIYALFL